MGLKLKIIKKTIYILVAFSTLALAQDVNELLLLDDGPSSSGRRGKKNKRGEEKPEFYESTYRLSLMPAVGIYRYKFSYDGGLINLGALYTQVDLEFDWRISSEFQLKASLSGSQYAFENISGNITPNKIEGTTIEGRLGGAYRLFESTDRIHLVDAYLRYIYRSNEADATSPVQVPSSTAHLAELGGWANWRFDENWSADVELGGAYGFAYEESGLTSGSVDLYFSLRGRLGAQYDFSDAYGLKLLYLLDYHSVTFTGLGTRGVQNGSLEETRHGVGLQFSYRFN